MFGLLQSDRKKLNQRPPTAPGHKVTRRCEKWGLSLESVHQRSKVRVSYKPSGAGMISGAFFQYLLTYLSPVGVTSEADQKVSELMAAPGYRHTSMKHREKMKIPKTIIGRSRVAVVDAV